MERWPDAFSLPPRPLKRGVHVEIIAAEPDMPAKMVGAAIRFWVSSRHYQRALTRPGAMRFGLNGEPVEAVSPQHQADAAAWLRTMAMRRRAATSARSPKPERDTPTNAEGKPVRS
jgi:sRNA-binding protein